MFIGHYSVGLIAKKYAPQVSLGIFFMACQLADLIWPSLVLLGIEVVKIDPGNTVMTPLHFVSYPYSHSLMALLLWSGLFAGIYLLLTRSGLKAALVVAGVVLSHWVLDVLTHAPDMPITISNASRIGLGLWNYPVFAVSIELLLFALGVFIYHRQTKAINRQGSIGFWALVIFLLVVYAGNFLGPPPPSALAVAWSAQALWLTVAWGFWIDHNRVSRMQ